MGDLYKLARKMQAQRKYLFLLILRAPFDALRTWMLAGLMQATFLCLDAKDVDGLSTACVFYGLICILLFFYNGTIWSIYASFAAKIEAQMQRMMLEKLLKQPFRRVNGLESGEWLTRLNSDVQGAFRLMNGPLNIPHMLVAVINTVLSMVWLFRSSLPLFVVTLVFVLPHLFLNYKIVLKHMTALKTESLKAMTESTSAIKPLITEADTIRLYDVGDLMLTNCEESSLKLVRVHMSIHTRNAMSNVVMRLFGSGGYIALLLVGYSMICDGRMVFADLVYCLQVRGSILAGVFMLITCLINIRANSVCARRINDTLEG